MKHITFLLILITCSLTTYGQDSIRPAHTLRGLEVIGAKENPRPNAAGAAVTQVTGAETRRLGIVTIKGLSELAPNIYMPEYGSRMTSSIYSRGLGARIDQPVMGLSLDNIPFMNKDMYDFDFTDIDHIEVLRGARSLLNGRNTSGGQINIYTLSPLSTHGLRALAEYSSWNSYRFSASYFGDISPKLGMSINANFAHNGAWVRNEFNGDGIGNENMLSALWKTVWRPNKALALTNTAYVNHSNQSGYPYAPIETGIVSFNDTCAYRRTTFADGLTVAWAGKRVVVTSSTSFQYMDACMNLDQDFSPEDIFTLEQASKEWALTEDLFTRGRRGKYEWLGGVFAFHRSTRMHAPVHFKNLGVERLIETNRNNANPYYPIEWDDRDFLLDSNFDLAVSGVALYHESRVKFGQWTLEAGLRLDYEHTALTYHSQCESGYTTWQAMDDGTRKFFSHTPVVIDDTDGLSKNYLQLIPKVSAEYKFSPLGEVYASFSKGYKAGGYNTQMFSDVLQQRVMQIMGMAQLYTLDDVVSYAPETSFNYEVGIRGRSSHGNLQGELNLFWIDCRNLQLTIFPPGTVTGRLMTNAGRMRSTGVELTGTYSPIENLTIRASYGYTNAVFRKYNDGRSDYRGKRVPYAPENTVFADINWSIPELEFFGITPSVNLACRGVGRIFWNEANTRSQNFYAVPDATIAFTSSKWSVRLWAQNFTNTRYDVFYFMSMNNEFVQKARPFRLGATFRLNI